MSKALAWPIMTGVGVWRLTPLLASLLAGRKVEVAAFGVKATMSTAERQQDAPANPATLTPATAAPLPLIDRPALCILMQRIRANLDTHPKDGREFVLLKELAISRLVGTYESIYNRIFGSQILCLRLLDDAGRATVEQAQEFFRPYAVRYPEVYAAYQFEGWLGFMTKNELVTRNEDRLEVAPFGHDFLVYLREARLTEAKLL